MRSVMPVATECSRKSFGCTAEEFVELHNIDLRTLRRWRREGLVSVHRCGHELRYSTCEIEPLLTARAVARMLGVCPRTLRRYEQLGILIPLRFGSTLRYRPSCVEFYLERPGEKPRNSAAFSVVREPSA